VVGYALLRDGPRASALAAIERARAAGMTVSVDPSSWALIRPGAIPDVDLLLPNEREAEVLGEREGMVVKLGAAGARWGSVRAPAVPVEVVDTTGAGDAFAAGFLSARLAGSDPHSSLASGCAAAARAVARVGARP
jgi:ribokinase